MLLVVAGLVLVVAIVVGWRLLEDLTVRGSVKVVEAELSDDGTLALAVESCNGDPEVSVLKENDQEVRVEVVASSTPFGGSDDCLDTVTVELREPLGDRVVLDEHSGETVSVSRPGSG
ncbi:MAG: hypothetical protein ACRDT6_05405 [Micromonosporaceae bacterium]